MARLTLILIALLAALTAAPATADADSDLWATVNVCDTADHPDEIGVRSAMPGGKRGTRLLVRFRVQYLSDGRWRYVRGADSGWRRIGRGRTARESGWSFEVAGEGARTLRGVVGFRWRRSGTVVRRARRVTEGGHRSTAGADPEDFSAATCRVS